jgi:hypothetical protein
LLWCCCGNCCPEGETKTKTKFVIKPIIVVLVNYQAAPTSQRPLMSRPCPAVSLQRLRRRRPPA